jgi:homoserine O-acetyltransferase
MRRSIRRVCLVLLAAVAATRSARAQGTVPAPSEGDFVLRDFAFDTGERLPELRIHYQTLGTPHRGPNGRVDNAVLVLHGTGGTGKQFLTPNFAGVLFGPGQLLDTSRYFVVMPDGIGHGGSSKPSNGMRMRFPRYGYRDMIRAQHRLLTEGLKVDHLRLVLGTSMGGMHTWLWGETHPEFMDALMPLASLPTQIAGRNRMMRRTAMDSIRSDPEWKGGEYETQPRAGLAGAIYTLLYMGSSPLQWQKNAPTRDAADRYFDEQVQGRLKAMDANDTLYQFDASRDYDPEPDLEKIRAPLVSINSADDEVNPPELGILERLIQRVPRGRAVLMPISAETRGHGTHSWPALWQDHLAALLRESDPQAPPSPAP